MLGSLRYGPDCATASGGFGKTTALDSSVIISTVRIRQFYPVILQHLSLEVLYGGGGDYYQINLLNTADHIAPCGFTMSISVFKTLRNPVVEKLFRIFSTQCPQLSHKTGQFLV